MITRSHLRRVTPRLQKMAWVVVFIVTVAISAAWGDQTNTRIVVWDTGTPLSATPNLQSRSAWKPVPPDLLMLEADPPRASSDPGYYGREYTFAGDAVVENDSVTVVFAQGKEAVAVYSRTDPSKEVFRLAPRQNKTAQTKIERCSILQNTGDEACLEVFFSGGGKGEKSSAIFAFDKTPVIEIQPSEKMDGISLASSIEYGVAPSFVGDDLIFSPKAYPSANTLSVPSENLFLGLLEGQNRVLVMTWPQGQQQMQLQLGGDGSDGRLINAVDFNNDGQSVYLALLEAPGIWHREELKLGYLEKDVTSSWKRPFPAKWVTQLDEAGVKATYAFRESKGQIWRGVPGMYIYPVWFDGDQAVYRLGKKVLPRGESIVYFLQGQNTPASIFTPVDMLKDTLGRSDVRVDPRRPWPQAAHPSPPRWRRRSPGLYVRMHGSHRGGLQGRRRGRPQPVRGRRRRGHGLLRPGASREARRVQGFCQRHDRFSARNWKLFARLEAFPRPDGTDRPADPGGLRGAEGQPQVPGLRP